MGPELVCWNLQYFKYFLNKKYSRCRLGAIRKLQIRLTYRPTCASLTWRTAEFFSRFITVYPIGRGSSLVRTISKPLAYLYLDFSRPFDSQTNATVVVVCQSALHRLERSMCRHSRQPKILPLLT
jgi:hypothetical protein